MPDPSTDPFPGGGFPGPWPCSRCNCTGYTPCYQPPLGCGGVGICANCNAKASVIASTRSLMFSRITSLADGEVIPMATAMGIQVPT